MNRARIAFFLLTLVLGGALFALHRQTRAYPQGVGGGVVSPDGKKEAVLLSVVDRRPADVVRSWFTRSAHVRETRSLRLHLVRGRYGSGAERILVTQDLPARYDPPRGEPHEVTSFLHWAQDSRSCEFVLPGTNLVLHIPPH